MASQTQISVIQSQSQQQPIVPIQQLLQRISQLECSPADVGSKVSINNISVPNFGEFY